MDVLSPPVIVALTLVGSLVLFVTEKLRYDAIAVVVVLVLAATGCLEPAEAFAGFSSPAVVLVAAMYAFAAAVQRTGVTEFIGRKILGATDTNEATLALRVVVVSGLLSSVLSNAAVVATLIPVIGTLAKRTGIASSRLLIPLSFGSLLGGLLTVIGTSKNIAVNGVLEASGSEPFGLFDFTLYGLALLAAGALFFWGPGRSLLPRTARREEPLSDHFHVPQFVSEVVVEDGSSLAGHNLGEADVIDRYGVSLLGIVRADSHETVLAPGRHDRIHPGDALVVQGQSDAILRMRQELDLAESDDGNAAHFLADKDAQLVETVVPAASPLVGRSLIETDFRARTGLNVLAVSQHGEVQPDKLASTRLAVGDSLLVQGRPKDLHNIVENRELIVLVEHEPPNVSRHAVITVGMLAGVLLLSALTPIHISVAALGGALGLVLTRCIRADHVRRGIDWSVLILIGGMLALGAAFEKHGLNQVIASWLSAVGGSGSPLLVLGALFLTTLVLTQLINHVAAAVIMAPVALSLAAQLGMNDRAFLMAVLTGAELAFMSPVAHQANAMVMGPGGYKYRDFLKVGTPLTVVLGLIAVVLLPVFWPL